MQPNRIDIGEFPPADGAAELSSRSTPATAETLAVELLTGERAGQLVRIDETPVMIGRSPECGLVLPAPMVSRHHARIRRGRSGATIEDLGSVNGTYINGARVAGRCPLVAGDHLQIDEFHLRVVSIPRSDMGTLLPGDSAARQNEATSEGLSCSTAILELRAVAHPDPLRDEPHAQQKLDAIFELTRATEDSLQLSDLLPRILDAAFRIFPGAHRGWILMPAAPGAPPVPTVGRTRDGRAAGNLPTAIDGELEEQVLRQRQAALGHDSRSGDRTGSDSIRSSTMVAPLGGRTSHCRGLIYLTADSSSHRFSSRDLDVLASVAILAGQLVEYARLHQIQLAVRSREHDLLVARDLQRHLLPLQPPSVPGFEFDQYYDPAGQVGGDYFGYVPLADGRIVVAVGDVSGKGVSAALLMARLCSEVNYCFAMSDTADAGIGRLNRSLSQSVLHGRFITFVACVLDPASREITVVNAGHVPPMILSRQSHQVEQISPEHSGPPLGLRPEWEYKPVHRVLQPGDTVLTLTDGLSEAISDDEQMFGFERIESTMRRGGTATQVVQGLVSQLREHTWHAQHKDDVCIVAFGPTQ
ncbi:Phosphoserine phosphatase RsbU [Maioricimonas rarisocia]|uniref:Phosphoserine phosphatase RsbU n=1 Tax=Maioricimonas rarisocia TaxID=2528026 RepID=A0A517Z9A7_9PLAN|nr:SpoIIE family protein phosphatase [Maioricimonas rarisocia]QDU39029.1 Phosphoserine phosphatase RsbU [Maioricimonas rarisocia]